MIKYCLQKWDKNKDKLEAAIREDSVIISEEVDYAYLVKLVVKYILNDGEEVTEEKWDKWSSEKIHTIDDGEWQGTQLFIIPKATYQPAEQEYLMTFVGYGSCAGCDTLEYIVYGYEEDVYTNTRKHPTEQQVKDYMTLCRDLVSHMIVPYNFGWRHEEKFDSVEEE